MRLLLLTFVFTLSTVALAQKQEVSSPANVAAAFSRGSISCSTHQAYTIRGGVLDDKTPGIQFISANESSLYKLVSKSTSNDGKITIYGVLEHSSNPTKAKSKVKITEDMFQGKEYFQAIKFEDKTESIVTRCTNFREVAETIPDLPTK